MLSKWNYAICCFAVLFFLIPAVSRGTEMHLLLENTIRREDNIFFDATGYPDWINKASLTLSGQKPDRNGIFRWKAGFSAENYLERDEESSYPAELQLFYRYKTGSGALDMDLKLFYRSYPQISGSQAVDNAAYSHFLGAAGLVYRRDFPVSSFYLGYRYTGTVFPDYSLDSSAHSLSVRFSHDLSLFTTVEIKGSFVYRIYRERYQLDSSGTANGDIFFDTETAGGLSLKHFFGSETSVQIDAAFRRLYSNGNFYFYGPGETALVVDGDELLIYDFYSFTEAGVKLVFRQKLRNLTVTITGGYLYRKYDGRLAFTAADEPVAGLFEDWNILSAGLRTDWRILETLQLSLSAIYRKNRSSSYTRDTDSFSAGAGVRLWF